MIDAGGYCLLLVAAVVTYFVCGIPFGLLIASKEGHIDVRKVGSGNIGTTNVARSVGAKAGGLTLLLDALKGFLSTLIWQQVFCAVLFGGNASLVAPAGPYGWMASVIFLAAICGHVFSPYLHFHGGKGIAVGFGAALGYMPAVAFGLLLVFVVFAVPSRYVSLGSSMAAVSLPIWAAVTGAAPATIWPLVAITVIVVWAHRGNIKKLVHGEERKFSFHHESKDAK
ncbi:MAG: glycerol-3-phosphate 1-O-acyltransferase PlsY [Atopobiaceae bacterium]